MIQEQDFKEFKYNILGANSKIVGDLVLSGDAIITSRIEGSIKVIGEGRLILERGSFVEGKIEAHNVEIFGTVNGEIRSSGTVSVRASAKIYGSLESKKLVVYPGALVEMDIHTLSQD
jgi:cytoskeletal protein CcmA (bactofilin family)